MLKRSNQRHLNAGWEPFATSTPLKIVPNNAYFEKESQKQFQLRTDSLDIIKKLQRTYNSANVSVEKPGEVKRFVNNRSRKSKSFADLDFSSSDEDNAREKKRPIIKISIKKQANSLLTNKKSDEGVKCVKGNITSNHNNCTASSSESNKFDQSLKHCYNRILNSKTKKLNNVNPATNNIDSDPDGENQIFDKVIDSNNDSKLSLKKKDNTEHKKDDNFKLSRNCKYKFGKSEQEPKTDSVAQKDSQICNNFQKPTLEKKVIKRKCKNVESAVNSVKISRSKKAKTKLPTTVINESEKNAVNVSENKRNTSHQLFSDSKEQELINTLDLTSEETSDIKGSKSLWSKENRSTLPHPSNHRSFFETQNKDKPTNSCNPENAQLIKDMPKEQLSANGPEEQLNLEKDLEINKKSNELIQEFEVVKNSEEVNVCPKAKHIGIKKTEKKVKKKAVSKIGRKKETVPSNVPNNLNDKDHNGVVSSSESVENVTKNRKLNEPLQTVEGEEVTTTEKPVFKLINELSYKEDEDGCSAVECWDVNTFKCGVFKLNIKSRMTCRTLHKNSHLGGVLIKGNLRMKIGERERDLNQGDMAFVPPLTEWQAENIGDCESVFYYWCGRFKV